MSSTVNPSGSPSVPSSLTVPANGDNADATGLPWQSILDGITALSNVTAYGIVDIVTGTRTSNFSTTSSSLTVVTQAAFSAATLATSDKIICGATFRFEQDTKSSEFRMRVGDIAGGSFDNGQTYLSDETPSEAAMRTIVDVIDVTAANGEDVGLFVASTSGGTLLLPATSSNPIFLWAIALRAQ